MIAYILPEFSEVFFNSLYFFQANEHTIPRVRHKNKIKVSKKDTLFARDSEREEREIE